MFHRINAAAGALLAPVLARIVTQGVKEGTFDTFDPEGVADMMLQLGASTHGIVARAVAAASPEQISKAIRALERRIRLYELALDRILGLPDGSVRLAEPGYVRMIRTARRAAPGRRPVRAPRAKG